jgi:hypothetical protein
VPHWTQTSPAHIYCGMWFLRMYSQSVRTVWITANDAINSSHPAGPPPGYYWQNVEGYSKCGHGFVRAADGTVVTFDAPGAGTGGTNAFDISPSGEAMGWYLDSNFTFHGFVRKP